MKQLISIKPIDKSYNTGEEPVLVLCNDHYSYVCKYPRYSGSSNKLVCELMGAIFAKKWNLNTPDASFVKVLQQHVPYNMSGSFFSSPIIGSKLCNNVIDVTPTSIEQIPSNADILRQLMHIALFDFWIANEDRNANNSNLMYDYIRQELVVIDFGCSFNTATFDFPLSQLTETDSILCSDFFEHISKDVPTELIYQIADTLTREDFCKYIHDCESVLQIINRDENMNEGVESFFIPMAWQINRQRLRKKVEELLNDAWTKAVVNNFNETLKTVLNNE